MANCVSLCMFSILDRDKKKKECFLKVGFNFFVLRQNNLHGLFNAKAIYV